MKLFNPLQTVTSLFRSQPKQIGLPPGSLVHIGEQKVERPVFSSFHYDNQHLQREKDITLDSCLQSLERPGISWINLDGIHDVSVLERCGQAFAIHPLALEDILNTGHPPKFEDFDDCLLLITKMFYFNEKESRLEAEQISLILKKGVLLTFQERSGDVFDGVRARLERKSGRIRQRGAAYLAYALIDSIVDSYFHVLERIGDQLDELENELLKQPSQSVLQQIHQMKGLLSFLRKSIWSTRELVNQLRHNESSLLDESIAPFLRDLYDHTIQVLDTVESYRETASGLVDLYMSSVSQRMNEVMQVLTIMASIFIPLTFIAGIYGMNFELMPELKWRYGYPMVWGLMLLCAIGLLWFFKRKKWF